MSPRPRLRRRCGGFTVLVAAGMAFGLSGCGADVPSRPGLAEVLALSGVPKAEARCAADAILGSLSKDQVASIVARGSSGAPLDDPDRTDDASDKVRAALTACRSEAPATGDGSAASTTTTRPAEPSSTVTTRPASMQASTTSTSTSAPETSSTSTP